MFINFILPSVATLLISSLTTVNAFVLTRDVIVPPVLYPTDGTQWVVGQRHNVTWDLSVVPSGFTGTGMIVLGFIEGSDDGSEHLDLDHPLATGFLISAGRTEITVPTVSDRSDYIVVLFGDSGNASGKFTIKNIGISSPGSTSTTPPSTTPTPTGSVTSSTTVSTTSGSGTDSATTTTDSNSTETNSTPATGSTNSEVAPSTPADTATGAPSTPSPTAAGFPVADSASSTPSAISSLAQSVSPSSTAPASTQTSSNTTNTQNNAGSPLGSINFAVVISAICAYVAL